MIRAFKATGCAVCGVRYPDVDWSELHIDHIDRRDKPRDVPHAIGSSGSPGAARYTSRASVERILSELLKCQVLCRTHHLEKHRNEVPPAADQLVLFAGNGGWSY